MRPKLAKKYQRVKRSVSLAPETMHFLRKKAVAGKSVGNVIDDLRLFFEAQSTEKQALA